MIVTCSCRSRFRTGRRPIIVVGGLVATVLDVIVETGLHQQVRRVQYGNDEENSSSSTAPMKERLFPSTSRIAARPHPTGARRHRHRRRLPNPLDLIDVALDLIKVAGWRETGTERPKEQVLGGIHRELSVVAVVVKTVDWIERQRGQRNVKARSVARAERCQSASAPSSSSPASTSLPPLP